MYLTQVQIIESKTNSKLSIIVYQMHGFKGTISVKSLLEEFKRDPIYLHISLLE